jgi:hypothetical protein
MKQYCKFCNENLTKSLKKNITFNWKTIECHNCGNINNIVLPDWAKNSTFIGIPYGMGIASVIYLNIPLYLRVLLIIFGIIIAYIIFINILISKIELEK